MSTALFRQQSTDTISSHDSYDYDEYDPYEDEKPPMKHVSKVNGIHPNRDNRAATKIQSLLRGKKGRVRAVTMRNAQANEAMFNLADIDSILKELEDCHSENDILKQQLVQLKGESKKQGGKRRRRKTRRKTHKKKSKSKRKTKRRRKSSKRRRR